MKKSLIFCISLLAAIPATSAVLVQAPTPGSQSSPSGNGMSHINVGWNATNSTLETHVDFQPVDLKPLTFWQPTSTFDPLSLWYSALDPTQGAGLFNSQYGLLADSTSLPDSLLGSRFLVEVVSGSATAGLEIYRSSYTGVTQVFEPILGTSGSAASMQWTGGMMHPMFVMPAGSSGPASVSLRFTITDNTYVPLVDYDPVDAAVSFNVIPEPSVAFLGLCGAGGLLLRRRRIL